MHHPDSIARFWASVLIITSVVAAVIMAATGYHAAAGYIGAGGLGIMGGFVAATSNS